MKNPIRLFGIMALSVIISFSMAACGGEDDVPATPTTTTPTQTALTGTVTVTYSTYSGEKTASFLVPNQRKLTLTLKSGSPWGQDTGIEIERIDGSHWKSVSTGASNSLYGNLSSAGTTVTLGTWTEAQFKMRTKYTLIEQKFYFKDISLGTPGSELFNLTSANGTKTYTLQNTKDNAGALTGVNATAN